MNKNISLEENLLVERDTWRKRSDTKIMIQNLSECEAKVSMGQKYVEKY